jgi:hypothetical protein
MNKRTLIITIFVIAFCVISVPAVYCGQGQHKGEQKMLDVDIQFSGSFGRTVTNASGIYYYFYGIMMSEDKVYPPQYWGEVPLYFLGTQVGVIVRVTNNGPKAKTKVRIKTESYSLQTDGSSGKPLCEPIIIDDEIALGETKTIDASFTVKYTSDADSGLDRFLVKVLHINEGGGPGNEEPGLIMVKEGVFCPPKYMQK